MWLSAQDPSAHDDLTLPGSMIDRRRRARAVSLPLGPSSGSDPGATLRAGAVRGL